MVRSTSILHSASSPMDRQNRKGSWTPSEDALLTKMMQSYDGDLAEQHGAKAGHVSWVGIAQHFENRNAKECRKRWKSSLCPGISRGSWTSGEDELLRQAMQIYPGQWAKIARSLGSRTGDQCSSRWRVLSAGAEWNEDRDRILLDYVNRYGKRWAEVRRLRLPMFTNAECRNRYHRIIRRLSAEKRHEAEIETLKLVCSREAAECSSSSSWSSAASTLSSSSDNVAGLSPTSRRASVVSSISTSSSNSSFSGGAVPWYAVDQRGQADDRSMPAQAKAMVTNEMAFDQLMQLAGALVSAWQPTDDPLPQQQQQPLCQDESTLSVQDDRSTLSVQDDRSTLIHAISSFVNSDIPVAGASNMTVSSPLTTSMSRTDGQAWRDVLHLPEYRTMPTATTTPTRPLVGSSAAPTPAPGMMPTRNIQTCRGCGFEPCLCDWANMWLSQASLHPLVELDGFDQLDDKGSTSSIGSTSISDRTGGGAANSLGFNQSLDAVPSPLAGSISAPPPLGWRM